jgi:hypothetical protein
MRFEKPSTRENRDGAGSGHRRLVAGGSGIVGGLRPCNQEEQGDE